MTEFGELWKHQSIPSFTESVSLQSVEAGHYMEEEEKTRTSVTPVGNQKIIRNKRPIRPRTIKDYKNPRIVA